MARHARERLAELVLLPPHYETTMQKDNVVAARNWLAQFPAEELVAGDEAAMSGKIVDASEIQRGEGPVWEEVSKG